MAEVRSRSFVAGCCSVPLTDLDRRLLSELLAGRSGSWRMFVDRFTGLFVQVIQQTAHAHSLKLSDDDIEDLCADTWAELLSRDMAALRSFRGRCSLATYLAVIVRRIVVRRLTEHRFRQALGHVNAHQVAVDLASTEAAELRHVDSRDEVESLLVRLPQDLRQILQWFYLEQASYQQIAARLGKPLNSIGPLLARLRQSLLNSRSSATR